MIRKTRKVEEEIDCGVEFGQLVRDTSAKPHYLWEVRLKGQEEWKQIRFRSETEMLTQRVFQRMCVRKLSFLPPTLKRSVWHDHIRQGLSNIKLEDE
jgi:hypothetical protein